MPHSTKSTASQTPTSRRAEPSDQLKCVSQPTAKVDTWELRDWLSAAIRSARGRTRRRHDGPSQSVTGLASVASPPCPIADSASSWSASESRIGTRSESVCPPRPFSVGTGVMLRQAITVAIVADGIIEAEGAPGTALMTVLRSRPQSSCTTRFRDGSRSCRDPRLHQPWAVPLPERLLTGSRPEVRPPPRRRQPRWAPPVAHATRRPARLA